MGKLDINLTYPYNEEFEYTTQLERVNLDESRIEHLKDDNGFIITNAQPSLKKSLKDPNSIFSTKFGQQVQDLNPFADRYKCSCGYVMKRINNGTICPICNKPVRFVDDNFGYTGFIVLHDQFVIHPNIFKSIEFFIGAETLDEILLPADKKDQDGFLEVDTEKTRENPFYGIGMIKFKEKYQEILDYFLKKNPKKLDYYEDLMTVKEQTFTHSIPVFTIHLRPFKPDGTSFRYEDTNGIYNMIAKLQESINKDTLAINRKKTTKEQLLYDIQKKWMELYDQIDKILKGKKGQFRAVMGGRYNFSSRSVIVPDPTLRIDEIKLPYTALVELFQQRIINVLTKTHGMSYELAKRTWAKAQKEKDERIYEIIEGMLRERNNAAFIINRNKLNQVVFPSYSDIGC